MKIVLLTTLLAIISCSHQLTEEEQKETLLFKDKLCSLHLNAKSMDTKIAGGAELFQNAEKVEKNVLQFCKDPSREHLAQVLEAYGEFPENKAISYLQSSFKREKKAISGADCDDKMAQVIESQFRQSYFLIKPVICEQGGEGVMDPFFERDQSIKLMVDFFTENALTDFDSKSLHFIDMITAVHGCVQRTYSWGKIDRLLTYAREKKYNRLEKYLVSKLENARRKVSATCFCDGASRSKVESRNGFHREGVKLIQMSFFKKERKDCADDEINDLHPTSLNFNLNQMYEALTLDLINP